MQVHYKIPGWEPVREIPVGSAAAAASPFPVRAKAAPVTDVGWRELLRLESHAVGTVTLGPPPQPAGVQAVSAETEPRAMRTLLDRHGPEADPSRAGAEAGDGAAIREMVLLLLDMQSRQDELAAMLA